LKRFFNVFGIVCLLWFSFFYSERTALVVSETSSIMIQIKEYADSYKNDPVDALIDEDSIIPGIAGNVVDINKSYKAIQNTLKGRLFADDNQFELSLGLFTELDGENACHIYVLPENEAGDFFDMRQAETL